ncbi:Molybdenum transport ATP-binding protein ModC (TC 3.A.1.8.1) [[Actinomadura] parvosata subsp. kistnae]|uniref:ABC transporter ATP-binding protein n=1 Tax=[Actinomadura] parvosata subsp. kistnae TaxID=1909395 RepID=A0A1V0A1S0_9ACTN|nr:ABC transporter ATP-binding protein [Nonomuraea sp. ATCC 55076]AQZ64155.1 ABC transporter ATP-binding protein [Nonomuraea sp. ATCC 55076]SPL87360.1 Molybdenum transport ATP-binding protein ModC (TC 3.A.1.8.1) [Actinomadura parvosata subsp. kistnae]
MTKSVWEMRAVTKTYGPVTALADVDLDVGEGETVAVLGPNGAGKSTLLSIALGLRTPGSGTARVLGRPPLEALRAGRVGVLLQESGLLEDVRVGELVAAVAGMYPRPLPPERAMRAAGVEDLARRRVGALSGGQRQRVRFALCVVGDPDVLVLDEPTVGLDVEGRRALWQEVRARTAQGRTAVFATHYLAEADDYADRVVLLAGGRVVADGSVSTVKSLVGGSEVRCTLYDADLDDLEILPGVLQVSVEGRSVTLRTKDSDATLRGLFAMFDDVRDVRVESTDLESAFVSLTGEGRG